MQCLRSLGHLVQRVQPDKADKILDTLCTRLVSGRKEADRESASISLKTTMLDLPGETAKSILRHVVPKLLQGSQTKVRLKLCHIADVKMQAMVRTVDSLGGIRQHQP